MSNTISPVKQRYIILDFLRGIALFGICLANFTEFSLYSFQSAEVVESMSTAGIDKIVQYFLYFFIDGKFYTLFSLLFGIGFSIIISSYSQKTGTGLSLFYRRMIVLVCIGLFHLYFLWAGDILILYAIIGLFLPLFRNISDKKLLILSGTMLLIPILIVTCIVLFGWNLSAPVIQATGYFHGIVGINEDNFPIWLANAQSYMDILKFNLGGSFIRMQEFIDGNRVFKVFGLFLLGLYIGRNKLYAGLEEQMPLLKKVCFYCSLIGIPTSILYAWNAVNSHPLGMIGSAIVYAISVVPMSLAYITAICLWYLRNKERKVVRIIAAPGKMALTNYLMQSVFGIILFYGIGFGLGAKVGLVYVELIAIAVFLIQVIYSNIWLNHLQFGPMEWGWRMLTYKKRLKLTK